jgi:hypothetical protein
MDLWSIYQNGVFPYIRLRRVSNPSILFSSNYLRVIFVRHPLERIASAYIDKIATLNNKRYSLYDNVRRVICRKYAAIYLHDEQKNFYRINKGSKKPKYEPCDKVIPKFEHFIEYIMVDPMKDDVHWKPYSSLCHICLLKYNFIGKFETIEEDLRKLIDYLGLNSNDWIHENYLKTGKTREDYKSMYSNLNKKLICFLKYFYRNDLKLFDYRIEDYLTDNKIIQQCPTIFHTRKSRIRWF